MVRQKKMCLSLCFQRYVLRFSHPKQCTISLFCKNIGRNTSVRCKIKRKKTGKLLLCQNLFVYLH